MVSTMPVVVPPPLNHNGGAQLARFESLRIAYTRSALSSLKWEAQSDKFLTWLSNLLDLATRTLFESTVDRFYSLLIASFKIDSAGQRFSSRPAIEMVPYESHYLNPLVFCVWSLVTGQVLSK